MKRSHRAYSAVLWECSDNVNVAATHQQAAVALFQLGNTGISQFMRSKIITIVAASSVLSLVSGETFPVFPVHAQPTILRIWQEAHVRVHGNDPHDTPP